ncbi:MAG: hypothetical protein ACREJD_11880 [Phycisphaerales bacterium]
MCLNHVSRVAIAIVTAAAGTAQAAFTITQTVAAAPTYANVLNFDAVGSPTGTTAANAFASYGVSSLITGVDASGAFVGPANTTPGYGWLGTGNVCVGPYGVYMKFSSDVSSLSAQYWDDSGPGSFFGGGAAVVLLKQGVEVGSLFLNSPAFNPTGKPWINVVASGGDTFDEIDFVGFGFSPTAYVDNVSWVSVPAPSACALLGLGGFVVSRRRRA